MEAPEKIYIPIVSNEFGSSLYIFWGVSQSSNASDISMAYVRADIHTAKVKALQGDVEFLQARVAELESALMHWDDNFFWRVGPDQAGNHTIKGQQIQQCLKVGREALSRPGLMPSNSSEKEA